MAGLVIADVQGQTAEGYDGMLAALEGDLKEAPGFIAHGAGPSVDGWKTFEVWETLGEATRFFAGYVRPLLPESVTPKRTIVGARTRCSSARWRRCSRRATWTPTCRGCRAWSPSPIAARWPVVERWARGGGGAAAVSAGTDRGCR